MEPSYKRSPGFGQRCPLIYALPAYERRRNSLSGYTQGMRSLGDNGRVIVLPMYAYHVILPMPVKHELNLFQRTVIRLLEIRNYTDLEISQLMCVRRSLVEYVVEQLNSQGLISGRTLTEKGKKLLSGELSEETECKSGYVFYDVNCRDFIESFLNEEDFSAIDYRSNGTRINFRYSDSVSRKDSNIHALLLRNDSPPEPPELNYNRCVQICRKAYKDYVSEVAREENTDISEKLESMTIQRFDVTLLPDPQPVYVATTVYLQDEGIKWKASDPFAFREYSGLTDYIWRQLRLKTDPALNKLIDELCQPRGIAVNQSFSGSGAASELSRLREVFKDRDVPSGCLWHFADALCAYRLLSSGNISRRNMSYEQNLGTFISGCYSAIEFALAQCREASLKRMQTVESGYAFENFLSNDNFMNQRMFAQIAQTRVGFEKQMGTSFEIFFGSVRGALKNGSDMVTLIAANLILAMNDKDHPFIHGAPKKFLSDMVYLKDDRDSFRHESKVTFSFDDVSEYMESAIDYALWLMDIDDISVQKVMNKQIQTDDDRDNELETGLENEALLEIQRHGINISEPSGTIIQLKQCVYYTRCGRYDALIMNAATLTELLIKQFSRELDVIAIQTYLANNILVSADESAVNLCTQLGCLPDDHTDLVNFFRYSNVNRFKGVNKLVCSSALYYSLICAAERPDGRFAKFVRGRSGFISDVCFVHLLRGHNGSRIEQELKTREFTGKKADELLNRMYDHVIAVESAITQ